MFSVIVPVYRQWHHIPGLLDCLSAQDIDGSEFELILVNNGPEPVPDTVTLPGNARLVNCTKIGSYAARNAGATQARGAWLVFTDADCRPTEGWLTAYRKHRDQPVLLAGPVIMQATEYPSAYEIYDLLRGIPQERYVARGYATTANLAVPAALFHEIGGFDECRRSGGDAAFCRAAGARGVSLQLVDTASLHHPCRTTWEETRYKACRIKGGQIRAGPLWRRVAWIIRSLIPPFRDSIGFLRRQVPIRHRLIAIGIRWRLWIAELVETARLLLGGVPERR